MHASARVSIRGWIASEARVDDVQKGTKRGGAVAAEIDFERERERRFWTRKRERGTAMKCFSSWTPPLFVPFFSRVYRARRILSLFFLYVMLWWLMWVQCANRELFLLGRTREYRFRAGIGGFAREKSRPDWGRICALVMNIQRANVDWLKERGCCSVWNAEN